MIEYEITPITDDFFVIRKREIYNVLAEYHTDIARNWCSCMNFQCQSKEKKAKYKCKHLKMCLIKEELYTNANETFKYMLSL